MNDKQLLEFVDNYLQILEKKTPKYDDHPELKGDQKTKLPDVLQKAIINKKTKNESGNTDLICPRCGTHNLPSNEKCTNCGLKMGEVWEGESWEEVN